MCIFSALFKKLAVNFLLLILLIPIFSTSCNNKEIISPVELTTTSSKIILGSMVNVSSFNALPNSVDNTLALQNAINSGQPLYLPKGTYIISKPLIKSTGTLIIKGENAIIQLSHSFPAGVGIFNAAFVLSNLTNINIDGLTIDGNRAKLKNAGQDWTNYIMGIQISDCSNIELTNCHIVNAPSISFSINNSNSIKLDNCSSKNGMYHGICFQYCKNAVVSNCTIIGIGNQGTNGKIGGIGILGTGCDNMTFNNNYIENASDTGTKTEGSNNVTWIGNTVKNSGKDGIKFQNLLGEDQVYSGHSQVKTVHGGKIINNIVEKIYNGRSDGSSLIQVWGAGNVIVSGNSITGGSKNGQEDGICVWSNTDVKANNITVYNNKITNTNRFIYLNNVSNSNVQNNICENILSPVTQYNGFQAELSNNIKITNNLFKRSGKGIIDGFAAQLYDCSSFTFNNNKLQNAYSALGLRLISSMTDSIVNNQMDNFSSYAISIYSETPGTIIYSLLFTKNTISKMGMSDAIGWMFKIDPSKATVKNLDLSGTKIIGNGKNGDLGLTIKGDKNIDVLNLTSFYCNGNAFYPPIAALTGCNKIIGWKSN